MLHLKPFQPYLHYLVTAPDDDNDSLNSDVDPPYMGAATFDAELDFDEYTDGEISETEEQELIKEGRENLDVEELKKKMLEAEEAKKKGVGILASSCVALCSITRVTLFKVCLARF